MPSRIRYPLRFGNITPINGQVNRSPRYPTLTPPPWARQRRSVAPLRSPTYEADKWGVKKNVRSGWTGSPRERSTGRLPRTPRQGGGAVPDRPVKPGVREEVACQRRCSGGKRGGRLGRKAEVIARSLPSSLKRAAGSLTASTISSTGPLRSRSSAVALCWRLRRVVPEVSNPTTPATASRVPSITNVDRPKCLRLGMRLAAHGARKTTAEVGRGAYCRKTLAPQRPRRRRRFGRLLVGGGREDRHLERQLAEGTSRKGHVVARAGAAGRAADAGDQACRSGRAGGGFPRCRVRAGAPRRRTMERGRHRQPLRYRWRGDELRSAAAPRRDPRTSATTSRSPRRG